MFWADQFSKYSDEFRVATDDGSYGTKGFVTVVLDQVLKEHKDIDEVIAIGPLADDEGLRRTDPAPTAFAPWSASTPSWWTAPACAVPAASRSATR